MLRIERMKGQRQPQLLSSLAWRERPCAEMPSTAVALDLQFFMSFRPSLSFQVGCQEASRPAGSSRENRQSSGSLGDPSEQCAEPGVRHPADGCGALPDAASAVANRFTMSPAGSIASIPATLFPACQYSFAASDVSSDARLSCHSDRSAYIERMYFFVRRWRRSHREIGPAARPIFSM